jgi:hypothetical protein
MSLYDVLEIARGRFKGRGSSISRRCISQYALFSPGSGGLTHPVSRITKQNAKENGGFLQVACS